MEDAQNIINFLDNIDQGGLGFHIFVILFLVSLTIIIVTIGIMLNIVSNIADYKIKNSESNNIN